MELSLATLVEGVIDYAGLFPPAKLSMQSAIAEYIDLRGGPHSWLVSRFAVSAADLQSLGSELDRLGTEEVIPLTVMGALSNTPDQWKASLDSDLKSLREFSSRFGERAFVESFEKRIPSNSLVEDAMHSLGQIQVEDIFVELPWGDGIDDALAALAGGEAVFAKARTGGLDAASFPSSIDLGQFIQQCIQLDLPFKLTAGLHHPLPHHDPATSAKMHGFINVLAASALTYQEDLSLAEIIEVLEEVRPRAFAFSEELLSWNGVDVPLEALEESRELFLGFGSCSVAEPVEGLAKFGFGVVPVS